MGKINQELTAASGFALDYDEPIPDVVERLEKEHGELGRTLRRIQKISREGSLSEAVRLLKGIRGPLLRHAVEEEARLMNVIMSEAEQDSDRSIGIMRFHRSITAFMDHTLPDLGSLPEPTARREVRVFISDLLKHHREEEELPFPLALKADSIRQSRATSSTRRQQSHPTATEHHSRSGSLKIPDSIVEEHHEIFSQLQRTASKGGGTGREVRKVLSALRPHFEREDVLAMPLLGALRPLSVGESGCDLQQVSTLAERLREEMPQMLSEHESVRLLIRQARNAAAEAKDDEALSILAALEHHAKVEEEVLYPAALLAGVVAKARLEEAVN